MSRPASGGNAVLNLGVLAVVVAVLCLLPMMTTPYYVRVATGVALWAGIALSWNVICGYAGYISFGHVAFFGIGAGSSKSATSAVARCASIVCMLN